MRRKGAEAGVIVGCGTEIKERDNGAGRGETKRSRLGTEVLSGENTEDGDGLVITYYYANTRLPHNQLAVSRPNPEPVSPVSNTISTTGDYDNPFVGGRARG